MLLLLLIFFAVDAKSGLTKATLAVAKLTDKQIWKRFKKAQKQLDKLKKKAGLK
jgi:hypothetical protein